MRALTASAFTLVFACTATAQDPPIGVEVFCSLPEVEPELIGGLEGLQTWLMYPEEARRAGIEGRVVVQFVVTAEGEVEGAEVVHSHHPALDAEALAAVRASAFRPGTQRGVAVAVRFAVPVWFRLRSTSEG